MPPQPVPYEVRISPTAQRDLRDIYDYVHQDSPQNASDLIDRLFADIAGLSILPHRYRPPRAPELQRRDIRCMPVFNYLVYYRIDDETRNVRVVSVQHGARRQRL